ncbi:cytochrome C oxidase subunit IV family protein [Nocardia sp. NPDC004860]|uniref:cytochrome C oxidase subunit IV family protein n=1 Tax=Nocardia sp. NPDC004860 TaxID=3154557 RepID=UPI0033A04A80
MVFAGLLLLTAVSSALAEGGLGTDMWVSAVVMTLAGTKIHFVGRYFMELRDAPAVLRLAFDGWIVIVSMLIIGFTVGG